MEGASGEPRIAFVFNTANLMTFLLLRFRL